MIRKLIEAIEIFDRFCRPLFGRSFRDKSNGGIFRNFFSKKKNLKEKFENWKFCSKDSQGAIISIFAEPFLMISELSERQVNSQAPDVPELAHQDIFQLLRLSVNCYVKTVKKYSLHLNRADFMKILSVSQDHCGSHNNFLKIFSKNYTLYGVYIFSKAWEFRWKYRILDNFMELKMPNRAHIFTTQSRSGLISRKYVGLRRRRGRLPTN